MKSLNLKLKSLGIIFFMLSMLFDAQFMAQTEVTVGTGTTTTGSYRRLFHGYYEDGYTQMFFSASDLASMPTGQIASIAFNANWDCDIPFNNTQVQIQTYGANPSSSVTSGYTTCFSGTVNIAVGWNTINFTTPFNYTAGTGILVRICYDNSTWTSLYPSFYYTSAYATVKHNYADGTPMCSNTTSNSSSYRPNTRFTMAAAPNITSLSTSSICEGSTLTITGTALSGATSVTIGGSPVTITSNSSTSISVTVDSGTPSGTVTVTNSVGSDVSSSSVTVNSSPSAVTVTGPNICSGAAVNLTASGGSGGTIYWQGTTAGGTQDLVNSGSTSPAYSSAGTYYANAVSSSGCWGTEGSTSILSVDNPSGISVSSSAAGVCSGNSVDLSSSLESSVSPSGVSYATSTADTYISNLTINGVSNSSSSNIENVESNETDVVFEVLAGSNASVAFTLSDDGGSSYTAGVMIYVDWNNDGDFSDASEAWSGTGAEVPNGTYTNNAVAVPAFATVGEKKLRIIANESASIPSATGTYSWGETELYIMRVVPASYSWSSDVGSYSSSEANPTGATPTENTTYTLTVTDANGCTGTATTAVTYDQPSEITMTVGGAGASDGAPMRLDQDVIWTSSTSDVSGLGYKWDSDDSSPYSGYSFVWTSPETWSDNNGNFLNGGNSRTLYVRAKNTNNVTCYSDAITVILRKPEVTTSGSLSGFTNCEGTASSVQSFDVSGQYLTNDIIVTAPTGFEVSKSSGSGYASSITFARSNGTVASSTVYVRVASGTSSGSPSGNVSCSSEHLLNGATTYATSDVAASATVTQVPSISSTTDGSNCGTGTVDLSAAVSNGTINWYAASSGGASLGTGTSFTTPSLSSTTTYYVDGTDGSCISGSRTAVTASILANPVSGTLAVDLSESLSSQTINWTNSGTAEGTCQYYYQWSDDNASAPTGSWTAWDVTVDQSWAASNAGANMNRVLWVKTITTSGVGCGTAETTPVATDVINCKENGLSASASAGTVANLPFGETITYTTGTPLDGSFERLQYQWNGTGGSWTDWETSNPYAYTTNINAGQTLYVRSKITGADLGGGACVDYTSAVETFIIDCASTSVTSVSSNEASSSTELTCVNTEISVTASGADSYTWSDGSSTDASRDLTSGATYTVTGSFSNGCTSSADITITENNTPPTVTLTNNESGSATEVTCANTEISVTAGGADTYTWSDGSSTATSRDLTSAATYTVTGTNTSSGCTNTAQITITENTTTPSAYAGDDFTIGCTDNASGAPIGVTDEADNYSTWASGDDEGSGFDAWSISTTGSSGYFIGNPANDGMGTSGIGTNAFGFYATGGDYLNASRPLTNAMAVGDELTFYWAMNWDANGGGKGFDFKSGGVTIFTVLNNTATAAITTSSGGTADGNYGTTPMLVTLTRSSSSEYSFQMTGRSGSFTHSETISSAESIDEINIFIGNQNEGNGNRNIYFNKFNLAQSGATYAWTSTSGLSASDVAAPSANPASTTTYTLTVTGSNGCQGTDNVTVTVDNTEPTVVGSSSVTDATTCGLASLNVEVESNGASGTWSNDFIGLFDNTTDASTLFQTGTYNEDITLTWTNTSGGCSGSTTTITARFNQPSATGSMDTDSWVWGGLTNTAWATGSNWYRWDGSKWLVQQVAYPDAGSKIYVLPTSDVCVSNNLTNAATSIGDVNIQGGTLDFGSSNTSITGNIVNDGTIQGGTGTVTLNGSSDQTISGSGTINFNNLTVNKSSGSAIISTQTDIRNTLTMTKGNIVNSQPVVIGVNSSSPGTLSHASGIVTGELRRYFANATGSTFFPVGTSSNMRDVTINFTQAPGTDEYLTVSYVAGAPTLSGADGAYSGLPLMTNDNQLIQNYSADGHWNIDPTGGLYESTEINSASYEITLHCKALSVQPTDVSKVRIIKSAGSENGSLNHVSWTGLDLLSSSGTGADFTITAAATGFSKFGAGSDDGNALPVELVSFSGACNDGLVELIWETASEYNSSHFDVENSRDGITWDVVKTIEAAGNSNELLTYGYNDANGHGGDNYYRLTQVDIDGTSKTYDVINVSCAQTTSGYFSIFPNPSSGSFQVMLNNSDIVGRAEMNIVDTKGNKVFMKSIDVKSGINMFVINESLAPGIYYVSVKNGDKTTTVLKHSVK